MANGDFFFHDWTDYNVVSFSIDLLEWGRTFSDFWGKTVLHTYGQQTDPPTSSLTAVLSVLVGVTFHVQGRTIG